MVKRRTNKEWQTLFEKYQSSHLSQRVFCERNELSLSTFYAKRQQLQTTESANISGAYFGHCDRSFRFIPIT